MKVIVAILALLGYATALQIIANDVPCFEIKTIVDKHNQLRTMVAQGKVPGEPKASNMQRLQWDDRLAKLAQNYANNMVFQHNIYRHDTRFSVGENLYTSKSTNSYSTADWNDAITAWFNEYKQYTFGPLRSGSSGTGHYTQVVWANTKYVGCGYAFYTENGWRKKLYVCNYGPAGNIIGQTPYKIGSGCENLCCSPTCPLPYGNACIKGKSLGKGKVITEQQLE